jgi:hypothetical protein
VTQVWKPTREECRAIREAGLRTASGGRRAITLAPRWNMPTAGAKPPPEGTWPSLNGYLVAQDIDHTDLHDYGRWEDFLKGIPLDAKGRAWVDFYIQPVGPGADNCDGILGNVTIWYEAGRGIIQWECV